MFLESVMLIRHKMIVLGNNEEKSCVSVSLKIIHTVHTMIDANIMMLVVPR
jgi:hypothetical protein